MLTVSKVATKAKVAGNTVRNWVKWYPDLFSESARGAQGTILFNDDDVEVICTLVALKNSGMPLAEAVDKLRTQEAPTIVDVGAKEDANSVQVVRQSATLLQEVQAFVQPQMDALRQEIADVRAQQRTGVNMAITMFVMGAAITLIVVALALGQVGGG